MRMESLNTVYHEAKLVVLTGPESTGKSIISDYLSDRLNLITAHEYARSYLTHLGRPYEFEDLLTIAKGQARWIDELFLQNGTAQGKLLLSDTDLLTIMIWSRLKYGRIAPWIEEQYSKQIPSHYLLLYPDIPWEPDPLRENPDSREELFEIYLSEILSIGVPFTIIRGEGQARLQAAENAILTLFETT